MPISLSTKAGLIAMSCLFLCCNFPRDPDESWEKARNYGLKVGLVNHPPFSQMVNDTAKGSEVKAMESFADAKGLAIYFIPGSESQLIKHLETGDIQLLIGGFEKKTLWKRKAGTTRPYDKEHVILLRQGENRLLFELEGFLNTYSQ